MLRGVVTGNVWSTKQIDGVPRGAFLDVRVNGSDATLVAFDVLGSGTGEEVIVAQGSVAASWFPGTPPPIDALIIGSVDGSSTTDTGTEAGGADVVRPPKQAPATSARRQRRPH